MLYMATCKPAHCKLTIASVITICFEHNNQLYYIAVNKNAIVASCWTYFTTIKRDVRNHKYKKILPTYIRTFPYTLLLTNNT